MNGSDIWVLMVGGPILLLLLAALDRWLMPWVANREVRKLLKSISSPMPASYLVPDHGITFDPTGFRVARLKGRSTQGAAMDWQEVKRVTAFKRDLFTVDCICLFFAAKNGTGIELNEEMAGWEEFTEALPTHLPGLTPWSEWFCGVAFPAFATNLTEIYLREVRELAR